MHFNAAAALTQEQHTDYFLGTIVEGPRDWVVRPVFEIFYERDFGLFRTRSALSERFGRSRTISRSTSPCAVHASMITRPAKSVPA